MVDYKPSMAGYWNVVRPFSVGFRASQLTSQSTRCTLMRKSYPILSAVFFALQGPTAFGHEFASRMPDQRPLSREMDARSGANETPNRRMLVQANPAPAAQPAPQAGATLPAQRTETINYDNWILTCREFLEGAKKRNCAATVAVQRSENGQTVFALSVQLNEQGKITASIQTPNAPPMSPSVLMTDPIASHCGSPYHFSMTALRMVPHRSAPVEGPPPPPSGGAPSLPPVACEPGMRRFPAL